MSVYTCYTCVLWILCQWICMVKCIIAKSKPVYYAGAVLLNYIILLCLVQVATLYVPVLLRVSVLWCPRLRAS